MYASKNKNVQKLLNHYREMSLLGNIMAILGWDLEVNLPTKGAEGRAQQLSLLESLMVDRWMDPDFKTTLEEIDVKQMSLEDAAIVRNLRRGARYYHKIPKKLILEKAELTSKSFVVWSEAKQNSDFKKFQSLLKQLVTLECSIAKHISNSKNLYDGLLDLYEPDLNTKTCKEIFNILQPKLTALTKEILASNEYKKNSSKKIRNEKFPIIEQEKLCKYILNKMSYSMDEGRLDVSSHPFTTELGRYDVRITTRYDERDFRGSFYSTVHEAGHGLYELGVNPEYTNTPLAGGVSLGIHESQSRFWENMVGRNPLFIEFLTPEIKKTFPRALKNVTSFQLSKYINQVGRSFIRTEADEVTYNLHIIIRFEIENDLMNGNIQVGDLPEVWGQKMNNYLGIKPKNDREGVLQDVHWSHGSFGYFPTYTLGNLYAAQFLHTMKKTVTFDKDLTKGNLSNILSWLRKNIHVHGSLYLPEDLAMKVTGETLNPQYFIEYIEKKYSDLFSLS